MNVQSKPESIESEGFRLKDHFEASKTETKKYDLTPGRVLLFNAGSSDADEVGRRANVELQYGLRLVPFDEVQRNRLNAESGDTPERLPEPIEVGKG